MTCRCRRENALPDDSDDSDGDVLVLSDGTDAASLDSMGVEQRHCLSSNSSACTDESVPPDSDASVHSNTSLVGDTLIRNWSEPSSRGKSSCASQSGVAWRSWMRARPTSCTSDSAAGEAPLVGIDTRLPGPCPGICVVADWIGDARICEPGSALMSPDENACAGVVAMAPL